MATAPVSTVHRNAQLRVDVYAPPTTIVPSADMPAAAYGIQPIPNGPRNVYPDSAFQTNALPTCSAALARPPITEPSADRQDAPLEANPAGSGSNSIIPVDSVQRNARLPPVVSDTPTTTAPSALIADASLSAPPVGKWPSDRNVATCEN